MSKYKLPFKIKMTDPKSRNAMEEVVNPYSGLDRDWETY